MNIVHSLVAGGILGVVLATAAAQSPTEVDSLRQPPSIERTAGPGYAQMLFNESAANEPTLFPVPRELDTSPSDIATTPRADIQTPGTPAAAAAYPPTAWTLPEPRFLRALGVDWGGWTEIGFTTNNHSPTPNYNGTVTFPDRANQLLLNQQWFYLDKPIAPDNVGFAWGGHADLVYGSDAFFTEAVGWDDNWTSENRYYQLAMPQLYADVAYNRLTARFGHFYTILGYETVQAPQNFFYTHAYTFQYGEPFTHTGALFTYHVNDQFSVAAGFHRGNDIFDPRAPLEDHLGFLGGVKWKSADGWLELASSLSTSSAIPDNDVTIVSNVATVHVTDRFDYILQSDFGHGTGGGPGGEGSDWYGVNQYWFYTLNECWKAGARVEWFRDEEGTRVTGLRPQNPIYGDYFPGDFWEISLGLNWRPRPNLVARPEVRWDWYDRNQAVTTLPFDNGRRASQLLFGCDFIVTY